MTSTQTVIVIDGHDGAGKTTLALALAEKLGGTYVKPFNGSLGEFVAWLFTNGDFKLTDQVARAAIAKVMEEHSAAPFLIFDRHWLSMFSVLPELYYRHWIRPRWTFVCWVDVETTCARLRARGEMVADPAEHVHFCAKYRALAEQFEVPLLNTTELEVSAAVDLILARLAQP